MTKPAFASLCRLGCAIAGKTAQLDCLYKEGKDAAQRACPWRSAWLRSHESRLFGCRLPKSFCFRQEAGFLSKAVLPLISQHWQGASSSFRWMRGRAPRLGFDRSRGSPDNFDWTASSPHLDCRSKNLLAHATSCNCMVHLNPCRSTC